MSTLEVKALALQLGAAVDRLEKRIDHATQQSLHATQALDQQAKQLLEASGSLTRQVLAQIRQGSEKAVAEGVDGVMQELDRTMRDGIGQMDQAIAQLDQRMLHMRRLNAAHAWKTFTASTIGSLAVIAVAIYAAWQSHAEIKRSEWVQQINAAVEAGRLTACPEGGLCVQVNDKWVRLRDN